MRGLTPKTLRDAVATLIGRPLGDEGFAVAVSGGPDSLALMLLAHAAFGGRVSALTVDHGLRAASASEAAMVGQICAARGIPHATLRWEGDKPSGNIQAAAREARYLLMRDWCARPGVGWLATGHHADDQAETLLMRLARGSGSGGLGGIRDRRDLGGGVTLLRPLLGQRRAALAEIVAAAGLTAVDDAANRNPRFDRTQARALLAATPWLDPARLALSAAHLQAADAALDWTTDLAWESRVTGDGLIVDAAGLPPELRHRLLKRVLASLGCAANGPDLQRFADRLDAGKSATLGSVAATGRPKWTFRRAPPLRIRDNH